MLREGAILWLLTCMNLPVLTYLEVPTANTYLIPTHLHPATTTTLLRNRNWNRKQEPMEKDGKDTFGEWHCINSALNNLTLILTSATPGKEENDIDDALNIPTKEKEEKTFHVKFIWQSLLHIYCSIKTVNMAIFSWTFFLDITVCLLIWIYLSLTRRPGWRIMFSLPKTLLKWLSICVCVS